MPKIADVVEELKKELFDEEGKSYDDCLYGLALRDALLEILDSEDNVRFTSEYSSIIEVPLENGSCRLDLSEYEGCNIQAINGLACNVNGETRIPESTDEQTDEEKNLTALDDLLGGYASKFMNCTGKASALSGLEGTNGDDPYIWESWDHVPGMKTALRFHPAVPDQGDYSIELSIYCPPDREDESQFPPEEYECWEIPMSVLYLVRSRARAYLYNLDTDDEFSDARNVREWQQWRASYESRLLQAQLEDIRGDAIQRGRLTGGGVTPAAQQQGSRRQQ